MNSGYLINNTDDVPFVSFPLFLNESGIRAGFSTRKGGVSEGFLDSMNLGFNRGDRDENVRENFARLARAAGFEVGNVVLPNQQHTINVRVVSENLLGRGEAFAKPEEAVDAQVTNVPGMVLIAYGADCVPVYLYDSVRHCIGICHAGWRGSLNNIVKAAVETMGIEYGSCPSDIKAVIGPSICRNCYEIGYDVASLFLNNSINEMKTAEKSVCSKADCPVSEKYSLDLWELNRQNLLKLGLCDENIEISGLCTKCRHDLFFSHRFHGNRRGVNAGFILLK